MMITVSQWNSTQQILIFLFFRQVRSSLDQTFVDQSLVHGPWSSIDIIEFIRLLQKRFSKTESRNSNSENLAWRLRLSSCWIAQMPEIIRIQVVKIIRNKLISEK